MFYGDSDFHCIPAFANLVPVGQIFISDSNSRFLTRFPFTFEQFEFTVPNRIPVNLIMVTIPLE